MGAFDFIYKPINPELLRIKVGLFVELYRKTQSLIAQEQKLLRMNASLQKEVEERENSEMKVRELNSQLIKSNVHLTAVNEELDRFAFAASHDLQEPLRKIRVFSDLILSRKGQDEDVEKYMVKITNAAARMQQLVNDLLRFSRHALQGGDFVVTDLNSVVKEAMTELEMKIQSTNAIIKIDALPSIPVIPVLMRQVFFNLLSNAIKFKRKELAPEVHIYAESSSERYQVFVKDNGIGIDSQYLEDIFSVFKRLHSYHEIEGSGIGLSICKKIMDQHNGTITATSVADVGSTFILSLPDKFGM